MTNQNSAKNGKIELGPFVGHTTESSTCIWVYSRSLKEAFVQLFKDGKPQGPAQPLKFSDGTLWTAMAKFEQLQPDTIYSYKLSLDSAGNQELDLEGLSAEDLQIRTMPTLQDWDRYRYDFLLLSCNNPDASAKNGKDGYEVWRTIPSILNANKSDEGLPVLFALMGGDQVYADAWRKRLLQGTDPNKKVEIYLEVYEHYWKNISYRKVLCRLPAYLMWDDHDIMDGWGSELTSFQSMRGITSDKFLPEWESMFVSAKWAFTYFQANRNPVPLLSINNANEPDTFDCAFRIGPLGFILADLRSNRNLQKKIFWDETQFQAVKSWVESNRKDIEVLFFLTPVVFAHGDPKTEEGLLKEWPLVIKFFDFAGEHQKHLTPFLANAIKVIPAIFFLTLVVLVVLCDWKISVLALVALLAIPYFVISKIWGLRGKSKEELEDIRRSILQEKPSDMGWILYVLAHWIPQSLIEKFEENAGDLSDDIHDAWGGPGNEESTEKILKLLFDIQNTDDSENLVNVAILSGDIHTAGYSNIYSNRSEHSKRPLIPHIVSSPVGYSPFPWLGEAVYRKFNIGSAPLGSSGSYSAQISHHFTERNVVICSVRKTARETKILKVKYYIEGFQEPQTVTFDLEKVSHQERIEWGPKPKDSK